MGLYGALGVGRLRTPAPRSMFDVDFDARYRLTELGLTYGWPLPRLARSVTVTAGHRTQVLSSIGAFGDQEGRDLTQGLALGVSLTF